MVSVVAARYAKALAEVVLARGLNGDKVAAELRLVAEMIRSSNDLRNALASPAVAPSRKRAVMARLTGPLGVSPQVRNFLYVVIDHRRVEELPSAIEAFETIMDERAGFVRAEVSSAQELTPAQKVALEGELSRLSGKRAKPRFQLDSNLIGGVVARVGSVVYDGSVRGQLERLRGKLGSV